MSITRPPAPDGDGGERVPGALSSRTLWAASLLFWTALGLLESSSAYVRMHGTPMQRTWAQVLLGNMPWWLIWAALTPAVAALARRSPVYGPRWRRGAAVQIAAATLFVGAHLLLEGVAYYYTTSRGHGPSGLVVQWRSFFANYLPLDVVTYCVIIGAYYAFDFYGQYRASAVHSARLEARAARLELGLAEARVQALRMELNPHFFFNALNAVSGLVRRQQNDAAVRMLARLGELLRATLDRDLAPEIPLEDELALLDRYLDIERVRFEDRLTVAVDADADARRALVPTLVLQPLVENAIRHGIRKVPGPARIDISARRDGGRLSLAVRDTGEGLDARAATLRREGIGLSNTRARLAELYGEHASLVLENAAGGGRGACVTITVPFRANEVPEHVAAHA